MKFERLAAILPVRDVVTALARYKQLGFDGALYAETTDDGRPFYGFVWRDGINLHLTLAADLDPRTNTSAAYLYVDDPDELYREWSAAKAGGELRMPQNTNWGMREMSYSDPDGNLLRIGRRAAGPALPEQSR
jgi:catechol 2,3-dioxygenase-like lactoylglutathione lyase family enzyme